ncbi:MAG: nucleotide exchange factor GrpE [Lachnospiraceae bacterium]|nr:nucleotide exchange factor GrpE [Lachnospiraceae bacterium]
MGAKKKKNTAAKATEQEVNKVENEEIVEETEETVAEEAVDAEEGAAEEKKDKKKGKADKQQERIDELEDKVKRQLAEFDNFRKRTEKEKSGMFEAGAKSVIEKILPVIDNFERGLASVSPEDATNPHVEGMNMIYKQLMTEMEKMEVRPIPAVGEPFDPDFHNAVMQVASDEYESGIIAQELQKGYTYRDSVVRHSMVSVVS